LQLCLGRQRCISQDETSASGSRRPSPVKMVLIRHEQRNWA